jgi:small multidrug resistance pump
MGWIWFAFTVVTDVVATAALGFSRGKLTPVPITIAVVGYVLSFIGLWQAMRRIDMAVVYALWSAIGTASIAVVGVKFFGELMTPARAAWLMVIVIGVAGLQLSGAHSSGSHMDSGAPPTVPEGTVLFAVPDHVEADAHAAPAFVSLAPVTVVSPPRLRLVRTLICPRCGEPDDECDCSQARGA